MKPEPVSRRDAAMFAAAALLSPLIATVPRRTARLGGTGGWLGVLLGVLPLMAVGMALGRAFRRLGCTGLSALYRGAFGPRWSGTLGLLYALWQFGMLITCVQASGERLIETVYPRTPRWVFCLVLLLLIWRAGWNPASANARMGRMFFFLLAAVVAVVLVLAARRIRWWNLMPVWRQDLPGIALAALPCAGLFAIPVTALWEHLPELPGGRTRAAGWCLGYAGALAAMGMVCTGVFGPGLTARLEVPFFSLAKECASLGRLESVVTGIWILSDVLFALLLLRGIRGALSGAFPRLSWSRRRSGLWILAPALPASLLIPSNYAIKQILTPVWMAGGAFLGYLLPLAACLALRLRGKRRGAP